jgi:trehalose-phosphatase
MVEPKPAGVGFHDRRVLPGLRPEWRRRVREILSGSDLEGLVILEGHRVVEVRPKGCSKGSVVNSYPPARRRAKMDASFLAMGDDTTDEDMFRAIRGKGLGVLVGPPRAFTDAARRLASPLQVTRFLSFLADRIA